MKQKNDVTTKRESKDNAKHQSRSATFKQNQKKNDNPDVLEQS
ncbi:hypothetical protein [Dehalobacter sp. DCM]